MENFDLKKYLFENKLGMYSKVNEVNPALLGVGQAEADAEMQKQDDQNGDMVDNVSMGLEEEPKEAIGVIPSVDKVKEPASGLDQYLNALDKHDWYYTYSDDSRSWDRGRREIEDLKGIYKSLNDVDKQRALEAFKEKYTYHWNPQTHPNAEKNIKYLTTTSFDGFV